MVTISILFSLEAYKNANEANFMYNGKFYSMMHLWQETHFSLKGKFLSKGVYLQDSRTTKTIPSKKHFFYIQGFIFLDIIYIYILRHFYTNKL